MENQQQLPGYFLLIPSHLVDNPNIDDATALLYGRIVSLSNNKGYCFASDKYLAELTGVSSKEIGKRLLVLEKNGYITRETKKVGLRWDRKIYPNFNYESAIRRTRTRHTADIEPAIRRTEQDKSYKDNTTTTTRPDGADNSDPSDRGVVDFLNLEIGENLKKKILSEYSKDQIQTAIKRCLRWSTRKNDEVGLLTALQKADTWKDSLTQDEQIDQNIEWLKLHKHLDMNDYGGYRVYVGPTYIEFVNGPKTHHFDVKQPDFMEKAQDMIKNLGL